MQVLLGEQPYIFSPSVACILGVDAAILLQQLALLANLKGDADGFAELESARFPFWSRTHIDGLAKVLTEKRILISRRQEKRMLYKIDEEALDRVISDQVKLVLFPAVQKEKNRTEKFVPPTVDDLQSYLKEIGREGELDIMKFYNYYQANGWMVGKNKMKSWKAAVQYWLANSFKKTSQKPKTSWTYSEMMSDVLKGFYKQEDFIPIEIDPKTKKVLRLRLKTKEEKDAVAV